MFFRIKEKVKEGREKISQIEDDNFEETTVVKLQFAKKIALIVVAVMLIVVGVAYFTGAFSGITLRRAEIIDYSPSFIEDYEIEGIPSECFYSTDTDISVKDRFKVYKNEKDFNRWYEKHHDIIRTSPAGMEECTASTYFNQGYYAVVISPTELFDPNKHVLATAKFKDDDGNVIISIGSLDRDQSYEFDHDLQKECKQIYTVIYVNPEDVENADKISFAIEHN